MCDYAYHNEALRKARIIERKNAALDKMGVKQTEGGYTNQYLPEGGYTNQYLPEGRSSPRKDYRQSQSPQYNPSSTNPPQTFRAVKHNMPIPELPPLTPYRGMTPLTPMRTPSPAELDGTVPSPSPMKNVVPGAETCFSTMDTMFPDDCDDVALFDTGSYALY